MDQAEASQPRRQTDDYDEQEAKLKGVREVVLAKLGMDDDDSIASTIEVNKSVGIHTDTDEALLKDVRISVLSSLGFDDDPKATIGDTETVQNDTDTDEALLKDVRLSILSSLGFDDDPKATIEAAGTETVRVDTDWTVAPKDEEAPSVQRTSEDSSIPRTDDCAKVVDKEKEILEIGTAVPENNVNRDPLNGSVNSEGLPLPPGETLQRAVLARTLATPGAYAMPGVYHPPGDSGAQQGNERDRETETEEATSSPTQTDHHQEGTEGLVVANMVTDASGPTLDQAEEVTSEELQRNKRHSSVARPLMRFLAAGFVGIAVLVVALVLILRNDSEEGGYSNGHSKESAPFPQNETLPPLPMTAEELVLSLLPNSTVLELSDEQSPQKRAFNWIIQDPLFDNYTDHRILQRYGLATFYYATGGGTKTNWYTDVHWLSYDHHECDWEVENIDWCHSYVINDNESKPVGPCDYNIDEPFISATPQQMEEGGIFQHLWLFNHELGGYIPEELTLVSTLKSLALLKSQIKGSIPSHLGRLSDLEALFLYSNDLSGTLPTELGMLPNIMHIWSMANPGLTGSFQVRLLSVNFEKFLTDSCNLTDRSLRNWA
ncbi:Leucine Rich Repeat [Seminavis robusta]|uniref:Leucine Rich Repeat n=1 Tax=Seminavis robusta TaxID=568900 RepID=A0A9N8HLI1_9STRA|nr:Leucine Rich Repeat [Seminavis robusta]|eukprot:Sro918_g220020.1 Leucine Rich Repeat (604) ;mRNA; r:13556-15367